MTPAAQTLEGARRYSKITLERLGRALETELARSGRDIITAVAGGSLGRLEATRGSDADLIVIVDDAVDAPPGERLEALAPACRAAGLRVPKADGIYGRPLPLGALLDPGARGSLNESPLVFGSRMQLLLDGRAVCREPAFRAARRQVLQWYASDNDRQSWTHLVNDLKRYLHAYAVWQQFKYDRSDDDGWLLRQAKFRSSRLVTFAGLLFLLAENCTRDGDEPARLDAHLDETPLERVSRIFARYDDFDGAPFVTRYAEVHARLADPGIRQALVDASPVDAGERFDCPAYDEIHDLTAGLFDDLVRFVLARRDDWPLAVYRNWLF